MTIILIITGVLALALGWLVGWLLMRPRQAALQERLTVAEAERERKASVEATLMSQVETLRDEKRQLEVECGSLVKEVALLKEQMQRDEQARKETFDRQLQVVKEQMQNETRQVLDQRAEALGKSNREQMSDVVKPLREQLEAMQRQAKENITASTANRASIEKAIEDLVKRTIEMSSDAKSLTRALQGDNRAQGNWGELVLETILEQSGLEKGLHYETQVTLRDESGRALSNETTGQRMIPDVIVHYPDGKDVIIDSKVSLTAYLDYCNAERDSDLEMAAQRHVASLRSHVRELRVKNYASYVKPPRQALQYMIMFVPNEMAMQLALRTDPNLWREAFESGICITSEQNLLVLLRMIQLAWTQVQQFQNQQEIMTQASVLLKRVQLFIDRLDRVNADIDKMRNDYDEARRAFDGRQGILAAAKTMERLGAKSNQQRLLPTPTDDIVPEGTDTDKNE